MRTSFSKAAMRSMSRNGKRCGRYSLISSIVIVLTVVSRGSWYPRRERVEPSQVHRVLEPFRMRKRRKARGIRPRLPDGLGDEGHARNRHVVADRDVSDEPHAAADHAVAADRHAACNAGAACDHGVGADAAVVADLDEVVELHAVLDHGVVER